MSRRVWLVAALVLPSSLVLPVVPASAICAGPTIDVTPTRVEAGQTVTVSGAGYYDDCPDAIACIVGEPCPPERPERQPSHVVLSFVQDGSAPVVLQRVRGPAFAIDVAIPPSAREGGAVLTTGESSIEVTIVASASLPATGAPTDVLAAVALGLVAAGTAGVRRARRKPG